MLETADVSPEELVGAMRIPTRDDAHLMEIAVAMYAGRRGGV